MKKAVIVFLLGIFLFFISIQKTFAATGAFIITPGVGLYNYANKRNINNQAMGNVSFGYGVNDKYSTEIFFGQILTDEKTGEKRNVSGNIYSINGLYHFRTNNKLQPHFLLGIGAINLKPHRVVDDSIQANINGGVGLTYYFNKMMGFRFDVRDFYTIDGGKHDFLYNFGFSLLLGGCSGAQ